MSDFMVSVTYRPGMDTVVISPAEGVSLRAIERKLLTVGVAGVVARDSKRVYLPLSEFLKAQDALHEWQLDLDPRIQAEVKLISEQTRAVLQSRQAIEEVTRPGVADGILRDFPERHRLDPHQVQAVAVATHPDVTGLCLFDEQGLGKTVTALFSFHRLRQLGEATRMLVIAPKNMVLEWVRDAERFFGDWYRVQPVVGVEREKRDSLNRPAEIYTTNFETTVRLYSRLRDFLEAERGRVFLVVDESFFVKNSVARRTQAVRGLRRSARRCVVLCGTPAPNSPHDLVEQFNIADGGVAFRGVSLPPERDNAYPIVQQVLKERGVYLRRLKQDVLPDLPGKTFHQVLVSLQPEQGRAYIVALRHMIRDLRATDDITFKKRIASFMAKRITLLQICSNPSSVLVDYREVPAKVLTLDAILDELIGRRGEKVVVWSFFTVSLDTIFKRYKRFNPVRSDGTVVRTTDRREAVRKFQEDDETMLFVGNPAASGTGLTLHRARYAVYESMSNQAAHYLQSLDRIHRRGQDRPVEYVVLLCDRTIEIQEYHRLIRKERAAQALLGDQVDPPVTRLAMLKEVMSAARLFGLDEVREELAPEQTS